MDKIEFRTADGTKCQGYPLTWEGLSFGIARHRIGSSSYWNVIELQTGCSVVQRQSSTRKEAIKMALEVLNSKGVKVVKKRVKEIFAERGNTKIKGRIKTAHCTAPGNTLRTLCGRIKSEYCLPLKYFSYAKKPCEKCQLLATEKKAS